LIEREIKKRKRATDIQTDRQTDRQTSDPLLSIR
jgi:hypothetical protein